MSPMKIILKKRTSYPKVLPVHPVLSLLDLNIDIGIYCELSLIKEPNNVLIPFLDDFGCNMEIGCLVL